MHRATLVAFVTALLAGPWAVERAVCAPVMYEYVGSVRGGVLYGLDFRLGDPVTLSFTLDWDTRLLSAMSVTISGLTYTPKSGLLPKQLFSAANVAGFPASGPAVNGVDPLTLVAMFPEEPYPGFPFRKRCCGCQFRPMNGS